MKQLRLIVVNAFIHLWWSVPLHVAAQNADTKKVITDSIYNLQEVRVQGRRPIATAQTMQGEDLKALSTTTVADALKYFAGVQIKDYGGLEKALSGSDDCFVKLDYSSTYSCATRDCKFYAIGSYFSYLTGMYEFNYITIDPKEIMESGGNNGIEESLPGTMLSDIMSLQTPYGIYVNPYTGYIYATDAESYASSGSLIQWSPEGELLGKHKTYINPGHFLALPPNGATSGINGIDNDNNFDGKVYDIYGRMRSNMQKGINIVSGKKVVRL